MANTINLLRQEKTGFAAKTSQATKAQIAFWQGLTKATLTGALMLAAGLLSSSVAAQPLTIIRSNSGGSVEIRLHTIAQLRSSGTRVEIRGQCASACTMLLGLPNTCVAKSARLGFHGPQSQYYGISLPPEEFEYWSQVMADHYPSAIRAWFVSVARQTTMDMITISGSEAIRMGARACQS